MHIRINLQTGKKEAKLIDSDEATKEKRSALAVSATFKDDDIVSDNLEENHLRLQEALKNIPDEGLEYSEEKLKEITKKFKYENIKQGLADMNIQIKTDFELMSDVISKYEAIKAKNDIRLDEIRPLFDDLEYLLHQIDNANDFVTFGGLEKIILPNLGNQTHPELKLHSIKLLGTLMQNNPKGQIAAFEKNVGSLLLQMLSQSNSSSTNELSSIIFALGGLLRKFPLSQDELLNKPNFKILVDLVGKDVEYKIKIKCLLLITDLIRDCTENGNVNTTNQYDSTDIRGRISGTEYCTIINELFTMHRRDYLESLFTAEDILDVLITSKDICQPVWAESPIFRHTLLVIKSKYDQMKDITDTDDVELNEVSNKLEHLNEFLFSHLVIKDEL